MTNIIRNIVGDPELRDVIEFQQLIGQKLPPGSDPVHLKQRTLAQRVVLLQEELDEFKAACVSQDLEELADALVDLVYVAKGTAALMNLPWHRHWAEVHRANMDKRPGVTKRGHEVDGAKPEGWEPPDHATILAQAGYDRANYTTPITNAVDDHRCF